MEVTGIGSVYSYIYNAKTNKLSTADGSKDVFTDYFNGDLPENEYSLLNGYDSSKKSDIKNLINVFAPINFLGNSDDYIYEISGSIDAANLRTCSIDGKFTFSTYTGMTRYYGGLSKSDNVLQPYRTNEHKAYDKTDNSINIAVGDEYELGKGFMSGALIKVNEDSVQVMDTGNGYDGKVDNTAAGIDALIRLADEISYSGYVDEKYTPFVLDFLQEQGVDTDNQFIVNGTKCEVRYGRIYTVGNTYISPENMYNKLYQKTLESYKEWLDRPLTV